MKDNTLYILVFYVMAVKSWSLLHRPWFSHIYFPSAMRSSPSLERRNVNTVGSGTSTSLSRS